MRFLMDKLMLQVSFFTNIICGMQFLILILCIWWDSYMFHDQWWALNIKCLKKIGLK